MKTGPARKSLGLILALASGRANRKPICLAITCFLVLLGSSANVAAIDFAAAQSYPVGTSPTAIAVGDFNGDGKMDIAVANTGSSDVSILLGNGDGTFQPAVNFSAGNSPKAISVGDFNGDGKLDLAVFQPGATGIAGSVSILLGNGDGTFQAPKTLALSASASFMVVADFNLDKNADLAVGDSTSLSTYIGNGDGTFQAAKEAVSPSKCIGLITADFNGDGKPDLAAVTGSAIEILLGKGDGTFAQGSSLTTLSGVVLPVVAGDINHDGKVDLVVNTSQTACSTPPSTCQTFRDLTLFLGNGDGTFQNGQSVSSLSFFGPRGPALDDPFVGDLNGDGKLDLGYQTTVSATSVVTVLLGKGDGSFSLPVLDVSLSGGIQPIAQDLNGDNLADLIAVGPANNITVWLNSSPTTGADLGVLSSIVSAGPYVVGSNLTFTVNAVNQGPQNATGVTFLDTLPNGVNFVSATATQGSCVQANGVVTCTVGSLASAFSASASIVVTPTAVGSIANTMSMAANEPDLVPGNNSASQTVTVVPLETLTVTDAGKGSGTVTSNPGAINCGNTCAANYAQGTSVSLTATPASGSIFSGWSGACTGSDPNNCTVTMNSAQAVTATFNLAPDFTLSPASTALTLQTGAQATNALTLTEQNGFSSQVNLSCTVTGPAPLATCGVSPSSVTVGPNPGTSTLTITAPTSLSAFARPMNEESQLAAVAAAMAVPTFLLGGIGFGMRRTRKRRSSFWFLGSFLVSVAIIAGCGGGNSLPPPQNYTVTVTATSTSGSIQHSTPIIVTVE
jgi:uncharacterized repeat protein (TIGR01451 family)